MNSMTDKRKTVLITGCSAGIGNALAREFHVRGLRVFATARSKDAIKDLQDLGMDTLSLDVTSTESVQKCKEDVLALTGGTLDYLVNNAGRSKLHRASTAYRGLGSHRPLSNQPLRVMYMVQAFSPMLMASKGTIVQIGSIACVLPYVFGSVYNASKAALLAYSNTLRVEMEPFGVKVVTVITGGVKSHIARTKVDLPASSPYLPIRDDYERRFTHSQQGAMDTEVYARRVVDKVLGLGDGWWAWLWGRTRRVLWEGYMARPVWFMSTFMWEGFFDRLMRNNFGLARLALQRKKLE